MGGLRSIIELGFAAIAIANFYTHISTMAKKLAEVIKNMATYITSFLQRKVGSKIITSFKDSETSMKTIKKIVVSFVRIFSVLLMCLAAKLKTEIKQDHQDRLEKLQQEYEKTKQESLELVEVEEGENMHEEQ